MELLYYPWNIEKKFARTVVQEVIKLKPFSEIFNKLRRQYTFTASVDDIFDKDESTYNAAAIADRNRVDTSTERMLVLTKNGFFPIYSQMELMIYAMGRKRAYGTALGKEGIAFVRPIKHSGLVTKTLDTDYAIELSAHELGGTFVNQQQGYEVCEDHKCFAYGQMKQLKSGAEIPPYGRDHFCSRHMDILLANAEMFRRRELP